MFICNLSVAKYFLFYNGFVWSAVLMYCSHLNLFLWLEIVDDQMQIINEGRLNRMLYDLKIGLQQ
jgi:hypothetical protein